MQFFKGDTPEQQFVKSGEIHGGKTGRCGICEALPSQWSVLTY